MTWRVSTGLRNAVAHAQGLAGALNRGYIDIYSGSQPTSADGVKGTLLVQLTASSGALTKETRATGSVEITAAAGGSINTITVGGLNIIPDGAITATVGNTAATASDLCDAINRNGIMEASLSGSTVTLKGRPGTGVTTAAVAGSLTTVTANYVAMGSGVAGVAPVNGLILGVPASGIITKPSTQVWSGIAVAPGTASWGRFYSSQAADTGAALSAAPWYPRLDGSCGVGSGDFQLSTINIVLHLPVTLDTFQVTAPAS